MPDPTDDELIAEWKRLNEARTPAPWHAHNTDDSVWMNIYCVSAGGEPDDETDLGDCICATLLQTPGCVGNKPNGPVRFEEDTAFIAFLGTHSARLLAMFEQLKAERDGLGSVAERQPAEIAELKDKVAELCTVRRAVCRGTIR